MIDNFGKRCHVQVHVVKLDSTGTATCTITSGYANVTFPEPFDNIPEVIVVRPLLAAGTWGTTGTSTSACTLTVTAENVMSSAVEYHIQVASFERS